MATKPSYCIQTLSCRSLKQYTTVYYVDTMLYKQTLMFHTLQAKLLNKDGNKLRSYIMQLLLLFNFRSIQRHGKVINYFISNLVIFDLSFFLFQ